MAIAFDSASNSGAQTTATTYNWTHTCTGSSLILVVSIGQRTTAGNTVSGVTFNTVALTQAVGHNNGSRRGDIWYLLNPATGAHSIAVTLSAAPTTSMAAAVSLTGVDQVTGLDATNTAGTTSATPTVAVTTVADNCWVVDCPEGGIAGTTSLTASGSQANSTAINQTNGFFGGISTQGPKTPAGAVTMTWTFAGGTPSTCVWAMVGASFKPVASGLAIAILMDSYRRHRT